MTAPLLARTTANGRVYVHPLTGEEVPSVTTIIGGGVPKPALPPWAAKMAAEYADANWDTLATLSSAERIDLIKGAHKRKSTSAADLGSAVHEAADAWCTSRPMPKWEDGVERFMEQFMEFLEARQPEFLMTEVTVWNRTHGYAGTFDWLARIGGKVTLGDHKCLARDVLVTMADGSEKPAAEVHHGDVVAAWDETGNRITSARVLGSGDNGIQPTYRITTKCGRVLTVTGEHPILTHDGWVKAADLPIGAAVRTGAASPGEGSYDPDTAYYLGLVVGDGSVGHGNGSVRITNIDPEVVGFLERFGQTHGLTLAADRITYSLVSPGKKLHFNPVVAIVRNAGLMGTRAATKFVPDEIMRGGTAAWRHFLAGYLDTDGCIRGKDQGGPRRCGVMVSWGSRSERLLRQCQSMLAGLGVRSSIYRTRTTYKGQPYVFWQLAVRDRTALLRLQAIMPARGSRTLKLLGSEIAALDKRPSLTGTLEWDRVISVAATLAQPTVWIEVAGHHTHVTSGIVSHNTGNNVWPEVGLQLSALSHAEFILHPDGTEEPLPHIDLLGALHLRPRSWALIPVGSAEECWKAFLAAKAITDWSRKVAPGVLGARLKAAAA